MKYKLILWILATLFANCTIRHDRQLIETAEALLYTNRDSAELLLRQVERPERLDDAHLAKYWFVTCDLHANSMQSLSEDSMICWTADYFRHEWLEEHGGCTEYDTVRSGRSDVLLVERRQRNDATGSPAPKVLRRRGGGIDR